MEGKRMDRAMQQGFYSAETVQTHAINPQDTDPLPKHPTNFLDEYVSRADTVPSQALSSQSVLTTDAAARINAFLQHTPGVRLYAVVGKKMMVRIREVKPVEGGTSIKCLMWEGSEEDEYILVKSYKAFLLYFV